MLKVRARFPLRVVLAATIALSPIVSARATEPLATDYLTPHSFAAMTIRVADLAKAPWVRNYPVEMLEAATEDFLGLPLESIQRVTLVVEPPTGANPQYAVVLNSSAPISFDRFRYEVTEHTAPGELLGRPLLESQRKPAPSLCLLDDQTLAIGPKLFLKRLVRGVDSSGSAIEAAMQDSDGAVNQVHAAVLLEPLRPLMPMFLMGAKSEAPPETHKFLDGLLLFDRGILAGNLDGKRESSLKVYANDGEAADQVETLLAEGFTMIRQEMERDGKLAELRNHEEAVARAWVSYLERMMDEQADAVARMREGDDAFVLGRITAGDADQLTVIAVSGILVALLLPAVQAAREAARRNQSLNNSKQIALAMHNYHDIRGSFPAQAIRDEQGRPLLSWRVALLPFLDEQDLYDRFRLNEPWNSPHNLALLPQMPPVLFDPSSGLDVSDGKTHYLGVAGPNGMFSGAAKGLTFRNFTDGTSKTLVMVQVDDAHAVEWTKPVDFDAVAHADNPVAGIGALHPGVFLGTFGDGHTSAIPTDTDPAVLRALMTVNGGEPTEDW